MDLKKWKKIFLDAKSYNNIYETEENDKTGTIEMISKKPLLTRKKLLDTTLYENQTLSIINSEKYKNIKYKKVEFITKENTMNKKFSFLHQMILTSMRFLKIENLQSNHAMIIEELSNIFEVYCYTIPELELTLKTIIQKNSEKREKKGTFDNKIYLKYVTVPSSHNSVKRYEKLVKDGPNNTKIINFQKIVRDKIPIQACKSYQFIVTKKNGLIHQMLSQYEFTDVHKSKSQSHDLVQITVNNTIKDGSCAYFTQLDGQNSNGLAMIRKIIEETKEVMSSKPSNYANEMGDVLEAFFTTLNIFSVKFKSILEHIQQTEEKWGPISACVKKIILHKE